MSFLRRQSLPPASLSAWSFVAMLAALYTTFLAVDVDGASAATGFSTVGTFGSVSGTGDGEFASPRRVAVEASTGNVFVVDQGNDRVQVFSPDASGAVYLTQFGVGVVDDPFGVAIDQQTGSVYVSDADDVVKFDSDGAATPAFTQDGGFASPGVTGPIAFDQAADRLLVADAGANVVRRYSALGASVSSFDGSASPGGAFTALKDVAVQDDGDVLVVDGERVVRFGNDGAYQAGFANLPATPELIAAMPGTDDALVAHTNGYDPNTFGPVGADVYRYVGDDYNGTFQLAEQHVVPVGLAVGGDSAGRLYATAEPLFGFIGQIGVEVFEPFELEPPTVSGEQVEPTSYGAKLTATVDPNRDRTTWTFEYGETAAYGKRFPVAPATIPAGIDAVTVSRTVGGLEPGTTYHYRLTAVNGGGTAGADRTFTTKPLTTPGTPDRAGRAYEQVTPADKNGTIPVLRRSMLLPPDGGDAIAYSVDGAFESGPTSILDGRAVSRRGPDGWDSSISPDVVQAAARPGADFVTDGWRGSGLSRDLSHSLASSSRALAPGAIEGGTNIYLKNLITGALSLVHADSRVRLQQELTGKYRSDDWFATSDDLSHLVLRSFLPLTDDAAPSNYNAFELSGGELRLAGVVDGVAPAGGSINRWISADGRRTVFNANPNFRGSGPLYMRQDGTDTVPLSVSRREGEEGQVKGDFALMAASPDGSTAYFWADRFTALDVANPHPLTDDANKGMYRLDVDTGELVDLTTGLEDVGDQAIAHNAPTAMSADGSAFAFRYSADGTTGAAEIYAARGDAVRRIAGVPDSGTTVLGMTFSPNGRFLAFSSTASPTGYQTGGFEEIYVYDWQSDELRCASCRPTGGSNAPSTFPDDITTSSWAELRLLDDGRVFYDSFEALAEHDSNGRQDVYEWDWQTQTNRLITPGSAPVDAFATSVSRDGKSVFFLTRERLVAQDRDDLDDIYVAREGGGIPAQDDTAAGGRTCRDDACQPLPSPRPAATAPRNADAGGGPVGGMRARFSGGLPGAKQLALLASGRTARVRVIVTRPGRVTITGRARIGGRDRKVVSSSRRARKPGAVVLELRLARPALRALRRGGSLRVSFETRLQGVAEPRAKRLTLRASSRARVNGVGR